MPRPVCAIVGSGEGLGASLARIFGEGGFDVAVMSRTPKGSAAALETARATGARAEYFAVDARDPAVMEGAFGPVEAALGPVEVLVYNVRGGLSFKAPLDTAPGELTDALQLEVVGAFAAARGVLPGMLARGRGTILFSSATAALRGSAKGLLYSTAKFGLRAVSQSLAKAYAAKGIHVVHVRLDCALDVPIVKAMMGDQYSKEKVANTDDVARSYLWVHQQPRSAWSNEVELRPHTEEWTI